MEYLIGAALALSVALLAGALGFAKDRSFYPTVMIVIASYYVLFAAMAGSNPALWQESAVGFAFALVAVLGFRMGLWWVAAALLGHGLFDAFHAGLIVNPAVPVWWPGFCLSFDAVLATGLAAALVRHRSNSSWPGGKLGFKHPPNGR